MAYTTRRPPAPAPTTTPRAWAWSALAPRLSLRPACDVWLVVTGAEERVYTGSKDHLGALALARRVRPAASAGGCAGR